MKKISPQEILNALNIKSIEEVDLTQKLYTNCHEYHVISDEKFLAQNRIVANIFSRFPINSASIAYRKKHSYYDFFKPHLKSEHFLRLDIRSFFHSISPVEINKSIGSHIAGNSLSENLAFSKRLFDLTCINSGGKTFLPIGFPSSPHIANLVFRPLDIQIQKICSEKNITYTRYADDMLFSSEDSEVLHSSWFNNRISLTVSQLSLILNRSKTLKNHLKYH